MHYEHSFATLNYFEFYQNVTTAKVNNQVGLTSDLLATTRVKALEWKSLRAKWAGLHRATCTIEIKAVSICPENSRFIDSVISLSAS